jgi:hypothetical protein
MVEHNLGVGIALGELAELVESVARQHVDRQVVLGGGGENAVEAGIGRVGRDLRRHHDADRDGARHRRPFGDRVRDLGIVGVDRLDDAKPVGMRLLHRHRVGRVPAVHGVDRDQQCAVDADGVHRLDHVLGRHFGRSGEHGMPRPAGMVALVAMDLGVDDGHGVSSGPQNCKSTSPCHDAARGESRDVEVSYRAGGAWNRGGMR